MAEQATRGEAIRLHLLVLRCQAGDERAFAQLFLEFEARTLRYLKSLVGQAADDVQQEVWLAVYRGISALSNPRAFRTWLFSTTRHRAIDYLRSRKREQELFVDAEPDADEAVAPSSGESVDDAALELAMAELSAAQREVLLLRYRDDMSYAEIALVAGCTIGTVRSRLHNAKRRLQDLLQQRARQDEEPIADTKVRLK
jgi:RNA polymerase sigma-70 factor (ECF subfamily)